MDTMRSARVLIEAGADVNAKNNGGWTPLYYGAQERRLEIAKVLIEAKADASRSQCIRTRWEFGDRQSIDRKPKRT